MIGYVAAGHKVIPPIGKITGIPGRPRSPDKRPQNRRAAGGLKLRSGYARPAFQPAGILILIDATLAASLSRRTRPLICLPASSPREGRGEDCHNVGALPHIDVYMPWRKAVRMRLRPAPKLAIYLSLTIAK